MSAAAQFALVDCNNFFVSCERAFCPRIARLPVVVLSNNDGCVVARSAEVKALGVKMGTPWFQMQGLAKRHGIKAFSSNYALYGDMSRRVAAILAGFSPEIEVYSIDESVLGVLSQRKAGAAGSPGNHLECGGTCQPYCGGQALADHAAVVRACQRRAIYVS